MESLKEKYVGLWLPDDMLKALAENPQAIVDNCDGVGSHNSWTYEFVPNTIWFLDITPASDIHDWMYTFPKSFKTSDEGLAYKNKSDRVLLNNMVRLFEMAEEKSWWARRLGSLRRAQAKTYYEIVQSFGGPYFWADRTVEDDVGKVLS